MSKLREYLQDAKAQGKTAFVMSVRDAQKFVEEENFMLAEIDALTEQLRVTQIPQPSAATKAKFFGENFPEDKAAKAVRLMEDVVAAYNEYKAETAVYEGQMQLEGV